MIFEQDFRLANNAICGIKHFHCNAARLFSILQDTAGWEVGDSPRLVSSEPSEKLVYSFAGKERATATISSWKSEFVELELVIELADDVESAIRQQQFWSAVLRKISNRLSSDRIVVASAPAKVNVFFAVGAFLKDGYHEVASCYQALALREQLRVEISGLFEIGFAGAFAQLSERMVPKDKSNLVYQAAEALAKESELVLPDLVSFLIKKSVPIAGGMAGGSADAAASLVALDELFQSNSQPVLAKLAATLGADVPFALTGGSAVGLGRGEQLTAIESKRPLHWVITPSSLGLATPEVYKKLDTMRIGEGVDVSAIESPTVPVELISAVATAAAADVAQLMQNDLEPAALELRPELADILQAGKKAGSLRSMISGSGPTVVHLAKGRVHAEQLAGRLNLAGLPSIATFTSFSGARLEG